MVLVTERCNKTEPVNLGAGMEMTIRDLVARIRELTGYTGKIRWDRTKPDGQPKRCLDVSRAKKEFGFEARMSFREGLEKTIHWYKQHTGILKEPADSEDHC